MPFYFTCPYCYKKTLVADSMAGQKGPCAGCAKEVTIPEQHGPSDDNLHPVDSPYVEEQTRSNRALATWIFKGLGLLAIAGLLFSVAIFLFWPVFQNLRARRNVVACTTNLQLIAKALNAYADDFGTYPPPIVYDDKGKPMHSWRVLILNYIGEESLYAKYNFNEPWDSQNNAALLVQCPQLFISPAAGDPLASESNYMLVTGNGTIFPKSGPLKPSEIQDGPQNTLLVVEVRNTIHEWTKPVDIEFAKLNRKIGAASANSIGGTHEGGATAVFADGSGAWLPNDLNPALLDALLSPNGAEPVNPDDFRFGSSE